MEKLRPSFTFTEERLRELQQIVPEAFADGKINWDALREALGDYLEEENQEHFGLTWPGKREARRLAAQPPQGTLVPAPGEGVNEDTTRHIFIEGENLEVLKLLQKSYAGRVKMIYIDPPYNTGNDFVYEDDYSEPLEAYLRRTGQMDESGRRLTTNTRASGRFHSRWLSMMYPRLLLARQLLREDGVIFVSIDDNEVHHLRSLMDEVFGEENFVSVIVWKKKTGSGAQIQRVFSEHEYILAYLKDCSKQERWRVINQGDGHFSNPDLDPRGPWESCAITAPSKNRNPNQLYQIEIYFNQPNKNVSNEKKDLLDVFSYDNHTIVFRYVSPMSEFETYYSESEEYARFIRRWSYVPKSMKQVFEQGKVYLNKGNLPRLKKFQSDYEGKALKSIYYSEFATQQGTSELIELFGASLVEYPKPLNLLRTLIIATTDTNDIILDFFAGSCTTAHAVLAQNRQDGGRRQFIMVQIPEETEPNSEARKAGFATIAEIGKERIRRVIRKLQSERTGQLPLDAGNGGEEDLGFRVFKLTRSHFKPWQAVPPEAAERFEDWLARQASPLVEDWTPAGLLTEILLQEGFPLDSQVIALEGFAENRVWRVHHPEVGHELFVCLDERLRPATVERLKSGAVLRREDLFICLDSALTDEDKVNLDDRLRLKVI